MTPEQVVEIIEYIDKVKHVSETLANLSESEQVTYLAELDAKRVELGL